MNISVISGFFNCLHAGHLDYLNAAKSRSDFLIAIVNTDWQVELKGSTPFMDEQHRLEIVKNIRAVDLAVLAHDKDSSVAETLQYFSTLFLHDQLTFYNSGDRNPDAYNTKEAAICDQLGIFTEFLDLPKRFSSSDFRTPKCCG